VLLDWRYWSQIQTLVNCCTATHSIACAMCTANKDCACFGMHIVRWLYTINLTLVARRLPTSAGWVIYLCDLTNQLLLQGLATLSPSLATSSLFSVFSVLCVSTPLMGLKARMNAYSTSHSSPLSAVKDIIQHEGLIGFYKGTVTLLWMFPLSMLWARVNLRLQIWLRGIIFKRMRNRVEEKEFTRKVKRTLLLDRPM